MYAALINFEPHLHIPQIAETRDNPRRADAELIELCDIHALTEAMQHGGKDRAYASTRVVFNQLKTRMVDLGNPLCHMLRSRTGLQHRLLLQEGKAAASRPPSRTT